MKPRNPGAAAGTALARWLLLVAVAALALQLFFVARIALMVWLDPQSTTFQRSQAWQLAAQGSQTAGKPWQWQQTWVDYDAIGEPVKRAVIAAEDGAFVNHEGVEWEAIEKAWERNAKAEEAAQKMLAKAAQKAPPVAVRPPRIVGGSTITQQLAKNLLLSGERTLLRKGQELVLTYALEVLLSKPRILEIYLNSVEFGEGVFGVEAAAQHYWRKSASQLGPYEAARLAVLLPRPRYFQPRFNQSGYLRHRARIITERMRDVDLP